jgi:tetraacyldisaccharide 4'-kinase
VTGARAARPLLWPLVPIYRLGLALREVQFRTGLKPVRRLGWPVVSIGNLSTGGSGKTPLTIALAKALVARGLKVDVLSRGYGRRRSALPLLVDHHGTAKEFGDEPLEIAREAEVLVYVAAERYKAGLMAETEATREQGSKGASQQVGVHLLDDGFQHRQLHRDIDILLLSSEDLSDRLLPAGNLREAPEAFQRATVLAIPADDAELERYLLKPVAIDRNSEEPRWIGPVWRLHRRMDVPRCTGPVAAFCGIARPDQFFAGLERAGIRLAARFAFPDHHRYTKTDLDRIASEAQKAGATTLLTTEKDRVRFGELAVSLPASLLLESVPLRIEIEDEAGVVDWLRNRLGA